MQAQKLNNQNGSATFSGIWRVAKAGKTASSPYRMPTKNSEMLIKNFLLSILKKSWEFLTSPFAPPPPPPTTPLYPDLSELPRQDLPLLLLHVYHLLNRRQ